jgi:N-acetylglucosamine-6-phosphate deacetylase
LLIGADMVARAPDGSHFVGSAITMKQAYANLIEHIGLSESDATKLTRDNPMRAVGIELEALSPLRYAEGSNQG